MATKKESDAAKKKKGNSWNLDKSISMSPAPLENTAVREKYITAVKEKAIQARRKFNELLHKKNEEAPLLALRLKWDEDIKLDAERLSLKEWELTRFRRQAIDKANEAMRQHNREALKSDKLEYVGFDKLLRIEHMAQVFYKELIEKPFSISPAPRTYASEKEKAIQARRKFYDEIDKKNEEIKAIRQKFDAQRAITLKDRALRLKWDEDIKLDAERLSLKEWELTRFRRQAIDKANEAMRQHNREALKSDKLEYVGFDKLLRIEHMAQVFYKELIEKPQVIEQIIELDKESIIKNKEKIKAKQSQDNKVLNKLFIAIEPDIRKIGQLLDLCCNLIPEAIAKKIKEDNLRRLNQIKRFQNLTPSEVKRDWLLSPKTLSDIFLSSFYRIINNDLWTISSLRNNTYNYSGKSAILFLENLIAIPENLLQDHNIDLHVNYSFEDYNKNLNKYKKSHSYTVAIIETIFFLLTNSEIKRLIIQSDFDFKKLNSFGDLLIDMGSIDSALKAFNIDKSIFHTPQQLSLLANAVIQSGNVTDSITLVKMLSEQEPFYPSIPKLQSEIKRLEQRHLLNSELSIDFGKVEELSGIEFENLLLDKFISLGFKVEPTPKTGDYGADLIVENNDGSRIIFQCKRFKSKVNLKAVQEVVGAMGHYAGDYGVVITNNTFLNSAVRLAESHDIELWDGDKLISFLAGDLSFSEILS